MSAGDEARERARWLRLVLDECERIMADPSASPERLEAARWWHDRLGGLGPLSEQYPSCPSGYVGAGDGRHTHGGAFSAYMDLAYDGWVD